MKYAVIQDNFFHEVWHFAVEADSLQEAIDRTAGRDPDKVEQMPLEEVSWERSHEASPEEWEELIGKEE